MAEEHANWMSHGFGLLLAIAALPLLLSAAAEHGDPASMASMAAYGLSIVMVYFASTLCHALPKGRHKNLFEMLDYVAIFLLIAGTCTPFALGVLRGPWGYLLLGLEWAIAVVGITFKLVVGLRYSRVTTAIYLGMGWLAALGAWPLATLVPIPGLLLLAGGGAAYTGGVWFFITNRFAFSHLVWHSCVLLGSTCHFLAVLWYSLAPALG